MNKLKKLNSRGFSHHFLMMLVVLVVGVGGAYYLVKSHADSITYDNGLIVFGSGVVINQDGSKVAYSNDPAFKQAFNHIFSPDGKQMVYIPYSYTDTSGVTSPSPGITVANSDGSNPKAILKDVLPSNATRGLSWSRDGQWLAFGVGTANPDTAIGYDYPFSIGLIHPDGSGYHTIPNLSIDLYTGFLDLSWQPSNTSLVYLGGSGKMCSIDIDGNNNSCINLPDKQNGKNNLQVSPDGSKVLMTIYDTPYDIPNSGGAKSIGSNVYSVNIDGSNFTSLTQLGPQTDSYAYSNQADSAVWSPDGKFIAYGVGGDPAITGLYIRSADGTTTKKISTGQGSDIAWQPIVPGSEASPLPNDINHNSLSCTVTGVTGGYLAQGQTAAPTVTITNSGVQAVSTTINLANYVGFQGQYDATSATPVARTISVAPNSTTTAVFPSFTAPYASAKANEYIPTATGTDVPMNCLEVIFLQQMQATLKTSSTSANYGSVITLSGTTTPSSAVTLYFKSGTATAFTAGRNLTSSSTGAFTTTYTATQDSTYYAHAVSGSAQADSAQLTTKVVPIVNGATSRTVKKSSPTTFSGKYTPGSKVTIYFHKQGDPAGKYPVSRTLTVAANSTYSYSFSPAVNYSLYVSAQNGTKSAVYTYNVR